jgi:hypothetical protein
MGPFSSSPSLCPIQALIWGTRIKNGGEMMGFLQPIKRAEDGKIFYVI